MLILRRTSSKVECSKVNNSHLLEVHAQSPISFQPEVVED